MDLVDCEKEDSGERERESLVSAEKRAKQVKLGPHFKLVFSFERR